MNTTARPGVSASQLGVLSLLILSATALLLAPLALPDGYSWIVHTTSESAAQGLEGAWVGRLGFLLMGFAVLWLAGMSRPRWGRAGATLLGTFGVMMLATAAFSHKPWIPGVAWDPFEDFLHSFTATAMGFAFAIGVIVAGVRRSNASTGDRVLDLTAVAASVVLPLAMWAWEGSAGVLQRLLFLAAYVWYGREALRRRTL